MESKLLRNIIKLQLYSIMLVGSSLKTSNFQVARPEQ